MENQQLEFTGPEGWAEPGNAALIKIQNSSRLEPPAGAGCSCSSHLECSAISTQRAWSSMDCAFPEEQQDLGCPAWEGGPRSIRDTGKHQESPGEWSGPEPYPCSRRDRSLFHDLGISALLPALSLRRNFGNCPFFPVLVTFQGKPLPPRVPQPIIRLFNGILTFPPFPPLPAPTPPPPVKG